MINVAKRAPPILHARLHALLSHDVIDMLLKIVVIPEVPYSYTISAGKI